MALSSGKILLIFKAHVTPLVLDFWPGSDRWLQLNGNFLSVKCICVCSRKEKTINIVLLKTNKKIVSFQIRQLKTFFFILIFKKRTQNVIYSCAIIYQ